MPPKVQSFLELQSAIKSAPLLRSTTSRARREASLSTLPPAGVILGIDPGLHRTGFGVLAVMNDEEHAAKKLHHSSFIIHHFREAGVLTARADAPLSIRLETLFDGLCEVLKKHRPDVMVVEELFSTYAHPRSALLMAQARGVLLLAAAQAGVATHSFLPNEVKQVIAGDGHASKAAMQNAVKSRLHLKAIPEPHDAADALALALCFALRQNLHHR
jgi:crossover junction endodeoxyribonuclease RuvC